VAIRIAVSKPFRNFLSFTPVTSNLPTRSYLSDNDKLRCVHRPKRSRLEWYSFRQVLKSMALKAGERVDLTRSVIEEIGDPAHVYCHPGEPFAGDHSWPKRGRSAVPVLREAVESARGTMV